MYHLVPSAVCKPIIILLTLLHAASVWSDQPVDSIATQSLAIAGANARLAYFSSNDISGKHETTTHAVIFIHGIKRNAGKYFDDAQKIATAVNIDQTRTLIISPQFLNDLDTSNARLIHWHREQWVDGASSIDDSHISGFAALDAILSTLNDQKRYPALKQIVIAGHSAGGQFVQRYAALNNVDAALRDAGINVRYVVANPSSYLWFDPQRPGGDDFYIPRTSCDYQRFKYGPKGIPAYAQPVDIEKLRTRYFSRNVIYLLGGADTDPNHPVLDKSCAAALQGPHRLARGLNYLRYGLKVAPNNQQVLNIVPGVGHDDFKMYNASCGRAALFGDVCANEINDALRKR